ncbi:MAG: hypothetical protein IT181_20950 [Acidobacteria bacterium]|nr:hypothetical protein [Acidobacteriota bacterium]
MSRRSPWCVMVWLGAASLMAGCSGAPPAEPTRQAEPMLAATTASASCVPSTNYAVLQVGADPQTDPKKVANDCWWQFQVPDIHGAVNQPLGWQLCNACAVDVEFELRDVMSTALTGCQTFFDASGAAHETVPAGGVLMIDCTGLAPTTDSYVAGARAAGETTPFVDSDPELEIDDLFARTSRLVQNTTLTLCRTTLADANATRLTIRGGFTPLNDTSSIALIPTGRGFGSTRWGGDLIETALKTGQPSSAKTFAVSVDLPSYVTEYVLRPYSAERQSAVQLSALPVCR